MFIGDRFNEAEARQINITDKAAHKLLEIVESRQRSIRLLPAQGAISLVFDKPKYDDNLFIENGVPILAVDKSTAGVIGDILIDADDSELGMLSIRRWEQDRYSEPEMLTLAA